VPELRDARLEPGPALFERRRELRGAAFDALRDHDDRVRLAALVRRRDLARHEIRVARLGCLGQGDHLGATGDAGAQGQVTALAPITSR